MASACRRFITRATASKIASLKPPMKTSSTTSSASPRFPLPTRSATSSPHPRFSISRTPSELGCALSLLPMHSAVAVARMTSCLGLSTSCRALSQDRFPPPASKYGYFLFFLIALVLGLSGPR